MNHRTSSWSSGVFACARGVGLILESALTGPDGVSWAPGRILGFATFVMAACAYIRITQGMLARLTTAADCSTYFQGSVVYFGGVGTVCIALVLGMAPSDPGGKWWGKEAAPPPPPSPQ